MQIIFCWNAFAISSKESELPVEYLADAKVDDLMDRVSHLSRASSSWDRWQS